MKPCPKDIEQSHVLERSLALAGNAGVSRNRRKRVIKNRFRTPLVTHIDGVRRGKWKNGHRNHRG